MKNDFSNVATTSNLLPETNINDLTLLRIQKKKKHH